MMTIICPFTIARVVEILYAFELFDCLDGSISIFTRFVRVRWRCPAVLRKTDAIYSSTCFVWRIWGSWCLYRLCIRWRGKWPQAAGSQSACAALWTCSRLRKVCSLSRCSPRAIVRDIKIFRFTFSAEKVSKILLPIYLILLFFYYFYLDILKILKKNVLMLSRNMSSISNYKLYWLQYIFFHFSYLIIAQFLYLFRQHQYFSMAV